MVLPYLRQNCLHLNRTAFISRTLFVLRKFPPQNHHKIFIHYPFRATNSIPESHCVLNKQQTRTMDKPACVTRDRSFLREPTWLTEKMQTRDGNRRHSLAEGGGTGWRINPKSNN